MCVFVSECLSFRFVYLCMLALCVCVCVFECMCVSELVSVSLSFLRVCLYVTGCGIDISWLDHVLKNHSRMIYGRPLEGLSFL